jgi:hypothetical protein
VQSSAEKAVAVNVSPVFDSRTVCPYCHLLQASLAVTVDPVDRAMRVRAGVVFPGPEWREDVYNEDTKRLELVQVGWRGLVRMPF